MENSQLEAVIAKLKRHYGAESDAELSRKLGLSSTAVAMWRKRQRLPKWVYLMNGLITDN